MSTRERIDSPFRTAQPAPAATRPEAEPEPAPGTPARLELRALSGWEEELLERHAGDPNTVRLCNEVLARCMVAPGAEPGLPERAAVRELLVAERDRELVALRRMSLGPQVNALVRCPECGQESQADFSLDALPLDFEVSRAPLRVEVEGGEAVLRLPTAGDQEALADSGLEGDAERRSWLIARCLVELGDRSSGFDLDFARGLPVAVRAKLEGALDAALPDLDLEMSVTCSHCDADVLAPFDVQSFFFFELSARSRRMVRDVHELARAYGWTERDVFALSLGRRLAYRMQIEADADADLLSGLDAEPGA
jgi:hypothetical protein